MGVRSDTAGGVYDSASDRVLNTFSHRNTEILLFEPGGTLNSARETSWEHSGMESTTSSNGLSHAAPISIAIVVLR